MLCRSGFFPLAACTVLGVMFLAARFVFTNSIQHGHLLWNVVLAWVPYVSGLVLAYRHERDQARRPRPIVTVILAATWLAFFPNAPYLVTDFVHFTPGDSFAWWYDVGLIATFAWTGFILAVVSLSIVQELVRQRWGTLWGWVVAVATILLSGVGIYLGRFVRLNSWDLVLRPVRVAKIFWSGLVNGSVTSPRTVGVTMMFSAMLLVFYVTWRTARPIAIRG